MDLKRKAVEGVRWTGTTAFISFCLGLIQIGIISRYLSAEEIGMVSLVMVVIGIGRVFSDAGMSNALIHFQDLDQDQINALYWLNVLLAAILSLILFLLSVPVSYVFSVPELAGFIQITSVSIFIGSIGQQYYILLKKELRFASLTFIDLVQRVASFLAIIIFLICFEWGVWSIFYGTIIGFLIFGGLSFIIGTQRHPLPSLKNIKFNRISECIGFGLFQMGDQSISYLSSNLDKLFISRFFGMDILGFYELATILIQRPITIINPIFNNVSFPLFSKMQEDLPRLNQWYIKKIAIISLIFAAIYCGMFAVKEELVLFLYGSGWELTAASLSIIFILGYFKSVSNPLGTYILALGRPDLSLYLNLYQIIVHISLLTIGVIYFNYLTAIAIYVVGAILLTVPAEYYLRKHLSGMRVMDHLTVVIKHLFFGLIMAASVILIKGSIGLNNPLILQLVSSIFIGAIVYFLLNLLLNSSLISDLKALVLNH